MGKKKKNHDSVTAPPPANEIVAGKEDQWMLKAISERN